MDSETRAKKIAQIGKLLAKAENPGCTPEEARTFSEAAERMMLRLGIDEAMARAAGGAEVKPEEIITKCFDFSAVGTTFAKAHVLSMFSVIRGLDLQGYQSQWAYLYVIGHESDVAAAEMLVNSLRLQMTSALESWWKESKADYRHLSYHQQWRLKMEFMTTFGSVVGARLREMNKEEVDATPGAALVLRDKAAEVQDVLDAKKLKNARSHSFRGSSAGARAGREANLGESALSGRKSLN